MAKQFFKISSQKYKKSQAPLAGFTFIELLIVATIIAILVAMSVPRFRSSYENLRLRSFVSRFERLAQSAHELSMVQGCVYKISVLERPDGNQAFGLFLQSDDLTKPYLPLRGGAGKLQILPQGYQIQTDENEIYFYPDGSATVSSIRFCNTMGESTDCQITVTGKIIEKSSL